MQAKARGQTSVGNRDSVATLVSPYMWNWIQCGSVEVTLIIDGAWKC